MTNKAPQEEQSAFNVWLARTGGTEPPNARERYGMLRARAEDGCSFPAEDMLWVMDYLGRGFKLIEQVRAEDDKTLDALKLLCETGRDWAGEHGWNEGARPLATKIFEGAETVEILIRKANGK